jgi:hypothetical protein
VASVMETQLPLTATLCLVNSGEDVRRSRSDLGTKVTDPPADSTADADPGDTASSGDRFTYTGPPRWVKVLGIMTLVVVLVLIVVRHGGGHGPGRHSGAGDATISNAARPGPARAVDAL